MKRETARDRLAKLTHCPVCGKPRGEFHDLQKHIDKALAAALRTRRKALAKKI